MEPLFAKLTIHRFILEFVHQTRLEDPGIGCEKLWLMFSAYFGERFKIGRDAFINVCRTYDLQIQGRRRRVRTTDSRHDLPVYPDLVSDLLVTRPSQVWVADITYILLTNGIFVFLSLVVDAYTHQVVGWEVADNLETEPVLEAFMQAYKQYAGCLTQPLIHHSDRGCQYASVLYTGELKRLGVLISMTQSGNPKDNAIAERVNGIIKNEFLKYYTLDTIEQVREAVKRSVDFYNNRRPHMSNNMLTPEQAALQNGQLTKCWTSYKDKYRKEVQTNE